MIDNYEGTHQASTFGVEEKKPTAATSPKNPVVFANVNFFLEKNRNLSLQNDQIELELKYSRVPNTREGAFINFRKIFPPSPSLLDHPPPPPSFINFYILLTKK